MRYRVEAQFASQIRPNAAQLAKLTALLRIHGGEAIDWATGWRALMYVTVARPDDAATTAGDIMRAVNRGAGMPSPATMTDIHIRQVGPAPDPPAED